MFVRLFFSAEFTFYDLVVPRTCPDRLCNNRMMALSLSASSFRAYTVIPLHTLSLAQRVDVNMVRCLATGSEGRAQDPFHLAPCSFLGRTFSLGAIFMGDARVFPFGFTPESTVKFVGRADGHVKRAT